MFAGSLTAPPNERPGDRCCYYYYAARSSRAVYSHARTCRLVRERSPPAPMERTYSLLQQQHRRRPLPIIYNRQAVYTVNPLRNRIVTRSNPPARLLFAHKRRAFVLTPLPPPRLHIRTYVPVILDGSRRLPRNGARKIRTIPRPSYWPRPPVFTPDPSSLLANRRVTSKIPKNSADSRYARDFSAKSKNGNDDPIGRPKFRKHRLRKCPPADSQNPNSF